MDGDARVGIADMTAKPPGATGHRFPAVPSGAMAIGGRYDADRNPMQQNR
jgi:hypothetical protein